MKCILSFLLGIAAGAAALWFGYSKETLNAPGGSGLIAVNRFTGEARYLDIKLSAEMEKFQQAQLARERHAPQLPEAQPLPSPFPKEMELDEARFKQLRLNDPGSWHLERMGSNPSTKVSVTVHNPFEKVTIQSVMVHLHEPGADGSADLDRDYTLTSQSYGPGLPPLMDGAFTCSVLLPEAIMKAAKITATKAWYTESAR